MALARAARLLIVLVALSGCAASPPAAPATVGADPSAATADLASEGTTAEGATADAVARGTIRGAVLDDELAPLAAAAVSLLELQVSVTTDEAGKYEFTNVPAGRHSLSATKAGYDGAARAVTVTDEEPAIISFRLRLLGAMGPYMETFSHTMILHFSHSFSSMATDLVLDPNTTCEECTWIFSTPSAPEAVLVEADGTVALPSPCTVLCPNVFIEEGITLSLANASTGRAIIPNAYYAYPVHRGVSANELANTTLFRLIGACDVYRLCYEERVDFWVTAFYGMRIPDEYSAFTPE